MFLLEVFLDPIFQALDVINFHLVGDNALLDRVDWCSHLVGYSGVQHCGEVLLTDHVIVSLPLRNINKLDHLALLVFLENAGYLEAKIETLLVIFSWLKHVYLMAELFPAICNQIIKTELRAVIRRGRVSSSKGSFLLVDLLLKHLQV